MAALHHWLADVQVVLTVTNLTQALPSYQFAWFRNGVAVGSSTYQVLILSITPQQAGLFVHLVNALNDMQFFDINHYLRSMIVFSIHDM